METKEKIKVFIDFQNGKTGLHLQAQPQTLRQELFA